MVVDSKTRKLSADQIVEIAAQETKSQYTPEQVLGAIKKEFAMPHVWSVRNGNTIFVCHKTAPGTGYFRALNADTAQNYVRNATAFCKAAYNKGFDVLVTQFADPSVLNVFRAISKNPPNKDMGYAAQQKNGMYQVTVSLGKRRYVK